jgi:uncharacterized repeat protein (TIGR01451 family)
VTLQGDVKLEKTVVENGTSKQVLVTPEKVIPGDHLVFSTAYHNNGTAPVEQFVVTNPLPAGVSYSFDRADRSDVSVDGAKNWGQLSALTIADGKGGARSAQASDVTHVRWTLPAIAPGASGSVSYHGVVR